MGWFLFYTYYDNLILVINYVSNNKLPKKYMTPDMLGAIINYIFQGENTTNDKNIKYYGEKIRNSVKWVIIQDVSFGHSTPNKTDMYSLC